MRGYYRCKKVDEKISDFAVFINKNEWKIGKSMFRKRCSQKWENEIFHASVQRERTRAKGVARDCGRATQGARGGGYIALRWSASYAVGSAVGCVVLRWSASYAVGSSVG